MERIPPREERDSFSSAYRAIGKRSGLVVALLVTLCLIAGCWKSTGPESSLNNEPSEIRVKQRGPKSPEPARTKADEGGKLGPRISALPQPRTPKEDRVLEPKFKPDIEKLPGYKVHSEYFVIRSERYPPNVAAVTLPDDYYEDPQKRRPLVLVFGGAGECARPPRQGALAWLDYYSSDEAMLALHSGDLTPSDFRGLAKESEIRYFNRLLKTRPYRGVIMVCPASPPITVDSGVEYEPYENYVVKELIPALVEHYNIDKSGIGVDGVSMGGARSMYYGFKYPDIFMSVGSIQGALGPFMDIYRDLTLKNRDILKNRAIQLVTSDEDPMSRSVKRMRDLLKERGIPFKFLDLTGPHDYIFNKGPGAISLLMFHDSALWSQIHGPVK